MSETNNDDSKQPEAEDGGEPAEEIRPDGQEDEEEEDFSGLKDFPEVVEFTGVGNPSTRSVHLISLFVIGVGVLIAFVDFPQGLLLLIIFLVIVLGYELLMHRRFSRPVRVKLFLRRHPVEAMQRHFVLGPIERGSIDADMEEPNELGYRPAPDSELRVWTFDSEEDARLVARRLLMYLPRDGSGATP